MRRERIEEKRWKVRGRKKREKYTHTSLEKRNETHL